MKTEYYPWIDSYNVKVANIDEQHKTIVKLINKLYQAKSEKDPSHHLERAYKELIDYAMNHFSYEEELLQVHQYPELNRQTNEHRIFVRDIAEMWATHEHEDGVNIQKLLSYLKDWWANHIQVEDKKFGPFLNSRGVN